jgi:hypothetical protein
MHNHTAALLILLTLAGGCASGYDSNPGFKSWLNAAQSQCYQRYGALPAMSADARNSFMKLSYDTYYGRTQTIEFANTLGIRYPNNRLAVDCLASAFPR